MTDRYALTLYTYNPAMKIKKTTLKEHPNAPEISGGKAVGQDIVIRLLATYGFLTVNLTKRCLLLKGHKRIDPVRSLEKMQYKGMVEKHTIHMDSMDKQDIDIYTLSPRTRSELKARGYDLIHYKYDMTNIPYILEKLSSTQWHVAALEAPHVREVAYNWRVALSDKRTVIIPSLTEFKTFRKSRLYLAGIPAPKGKHKEDLAKFLLNVYLMDEYLRENPKRFTSRVFVLICEDDKQAEDICRYMVNIRETAGLYFLYTNDEATQEGANPLEVLYELKLHDNKVERRVIRIG